MKKSQQRRQDYARGLYGYHDPTAGIGGAAPTLSALTLRLWLAGVGAILCATVAIFAFALGVVWAGALLAILTITAVIDFCWVAYRKHRGEPG